jgi:transposase
LRLDGIAVDVMEPLTIRHELSDDYEGTATKPMLPNKPRSVRRVNDRRVLNGIFGFLRSGVAGAAQSEWMTRPQFYKAADFRGFFDPTKRWMTALRRPGFVRCLPKADIRHFRDGLSERPSPTMDRVRC